MLRRQTGESSQDKMAFGMMLDHLTRRDLKSAIISVSFGIAFFVITGFPGASPLFTALSQRPSWNQ